MWLCGTRVVGLRQSPYLLGCFTRLVCWAKETETNVVLSFHNAAFDLLPPPRPPGSHMKAYLWIEYCLLQWNGGNATKQNEIMFVYCGDWDGVENRAKNWTQVKMSSIYEGHLFMAQPLISQYAVRRWSLEIILLKLPLAHVLFLWKVRLTFVWSKKSFLLEVFDAEAQVVKNHKPFVLNLL